MDSYRPPPNYMRPPPPPSDPHLHHHPPPPPPPSGPWFSGQFQFHPPHSSPPPPPQPPPPPPQQSHHWGPPPPPPPPPFSTHPNNPYPTQPYPPLPPHPRPPPAPPQPNQDWGNANWSHHSGWEYPGHINEDDWAAKARAWASARSAMDNQHPHSQFSSIARPEEPSHYSNQYSQPVESHYQDAQQTSISTMALPEAPLQYSNQYPQPVESHYQDGQQTSIPAPVFSNYQAPTIPLNRPPMIHQQEPGPISSYASEGHFSFSVRDGTLGADTSATYFHRDGSSSASVHQLEVPSSYSSVPGKEENMDGRQHGHSLVPVDSRAVQMEQAQFAYGNHAVDPMDQPLDFAPRFTHENDQKMNSRYPDSSGSAVGTDSVGAVSTLHAWTDPVASGLSYPLVMPAFPSALQHDPSAVVPPLHGQSAPMFGRGSSFQSAVSSITAPVGPSAGTALHPSTAFPVDAYGASMVSERSKKAAVPNWLREEIIKKKAAITSSVPELSKDGSKFMEDELIDKSTGKGDPTDSRSLDSSRSTEEDDDEDYEAQRTVVINQEIKRVLTEVLLKVTDELFDEIASKVLNEDDITADAVIESDNQSPSFKASASPPPAPAPASAPKASVKVLVPINGMEPEAEKASAESGSGLRGNVLGLANYSSDDNEDENEASSVRKSNNVADENGHLPQPEADDHGGNVIYAESDCNNGSSTGNQVDHGTPALKLKDYKEDVDNGEVHLAYSGNAASLGAKVDSVTVGGKSLVKSDATESIGKRRKESASRPDVSAERLNSRKAIKDGSLERDDKRHGKHESKSSSGRDKEKEDGKTEKLGRREERNQKKDKAQDHSSSKERLKDQGGKHRDNTRESDSRKRSPYRDDKDSKKERKKDIADKKGERAKDEKVDKSKHKSSSDRGRHKRRRSSSVSSRGQQNKGNPVVSDGSLDDAPEDSRRRVHSKRRNVSPSPDRSKGRQVSQSTYSKHTQRRHSPYPSLDSSRGRRSRSRSPVRRHR